MLNWANRTFWPMYQALQYFVSRVTWLKEFEYRGQKYFRETNLGITGGWNRLKDLERIVQERADSKESEGTDELPDIQVLKRRLGLLDAEYTSGRRIGGR